MSICIERLTEATVFLKNSGFVVVFVIVVVVAVLYLIVRVNLLLLGRRSVRLSVSQCVSHVVCSLVS